MDYKDALYFMTHNGATSSEETESYQMMVEAMEKQIPKKPINVYKTWDYGNISKWVCPSCSYEHRSSSSRSCDYKYCTKCGQAIDWSEVG